MQENNQHKPPKFAQWLLTLSVAWKFKEEAENDLEELFQLRIKNWGVKHARRQYWRDVLSIWLRRNWFEEFEFTHLNTYAMFKNYMKITFRTLRKQKIYTFINVFGLAIGLAFCALIYLYVQDELTYDKFHQNQDQIFRVESTYFNAEGDVTGANPNNSIPLGPALKNEIPGVEKFVRLFNRDHYIRFSGEAIQEKVVYADPDIFNIFTFPLVSGNKETVLSDVHSVVISEAAAYKYFGDENPVGKILQIRKETEYENFEVTGVMQDVPNNSTIRFDFLLSVQGDAFYSPDYLDRWTMSIYRTYILLNEHVKPEDINHQLDTFFDKYNEGYADRLRERNNLAKNVRPVSYRFNNLGDIHLNSVSDPKYSFILSGIALAILFIACINFMTLSIGRSSRRSKEIGMRKVVGALRHQLMFQFWGEAFIICFISLIAGLIFAECFLPVFNNLAGKELHFNYLDNWITLTVLCGFIIFTGFIAGSYPALILSKIKPVVTLKGMLKLNGSNTFTKALVVLQFTISVLLIIGTLVMKNQLEYTQNKNLGFNKEQVLVIPLNGLDGIKTANQFRDKIGNQSSIMDITAMGNSLGNSGSYGYGIQYNNKSHNLNVFTVESNYMDFMGLELLAGRNLSPEFSTDTTHAVLVNETLVKELEMEDPIGKPIPGLNDADRANGLIVGVVKDHYFQSMYTKMQPALISMNPIWGYDNLMIRIKPEKMNASVDLIGKTWKSLVPQIPFNFSFLDDDLDQVYSNDLRWAKIINYSSWVAILIACMGLFGLVTLTVSTRMKEVGIRKVLGASVTNITTLFAKDFVKLVVIGITIASPVAYYLANKWLANFAYHISVGWVHFVFAGLIVLFIAVITISVQTIKAGFINPAETLSNE